VPAGRRSSGRHSDKRAPARGTRRARGKHALWPQAYLTLLLQAVDRPCGWFKNAHLQNLDIKGKWKGRYGEALLFDILRVCGMFLVEPPVGRGHPTAAWRKAARVYQLVRDVSWGCFGRVWYARNVVQRHRVREHFKVVWGALVALIGRERDMAWIWDPNSKNLENFFLVSIVVTTDMQLNDAAIIELMHIAFKLVRPPPPSSSSGGRTTRPAAGAGEPQRVRLRPAHAGRPGAQHAA